MSTTIEICPTPVGLSIKTPLKAGSRRFILAAIATIEAFQEALTMRREAYRRYRLSDE
jgi:hypothetical protein